MNAIDQFIDSKKPLVKIGVTVVEEDWDFLKLMFPEWGYRSYFLAFIVSQLAKELRQQNITNYEQRFADPRTADIRRLMSNVRLIGLPLVQHDRGATDRACGQAPSSTRSADYLSHLAQGQGEGPAQNDQSQG